MDDSGDLEVQTPAAPGVAGVVAFARILSTEIRAGIVNELLEGEATVSRLAAVLDRDHAYITYHLRVLREFGLVGFRQKGRQRVYSLLPEGRQAAAATLDLLRPVSLHRATALTPAPHAESPPIGRKGQDFIHARTCYGHLGGMTGVHLLEEMLRRRWITVRNDSLARSRIPPWQTFPAGVIHYEVTPSGVRNLKVRGVRILAARADAGFVQPRRAYARTCPEWAGDQPHLGGTLADAILKALLHEGVLRREGRSRRIVILRPLGDWFGPAGGSPSEGSDGARVEAEARAEERVEAAVRVKY